MKCEICGGEFKNLGVHKFHVHRESLKFGEVIGVDHPDELRVDDITEKRLSLLISEIKALLKTFRNEIDVRISEKGGKVSEVEIRARIQP